MPAGPHPCASNPVIADAVEIARVEKPAIFNVLAVSGSLKETRQAGQELIWKLLGHSKRDGLRMSNLSVGLLAARGKVTMTFSASTFSLGYRTAENARVHVILRTRGGAALHTSVIALTVSCSDNNQTLHPPTAEIPDSIAAVVFANVAAVEVTEHAEPGTSGLKVIRCT